MHLRYCLWTASIKANENRHPIAVMASLGIDYQLSTPQSMADQWWFWNCKNIPDSLPEYLTKLDIDPLDCVGFGLNEEMATAIKRDNV